MSIRLHPEFGVNPSLDMCFWCGEALGVALLGLNHGKEAPRKIMSSYTPCEVCQEKMARGITLVGVRPSTGADNFPEIQKGLVPTGAWVVVPEEAVRKIFTPDVAEPTLKARKAFIEHDALMQLLGPEKGDTP